MFINSGISVIGGRFLPIKTFDDSSNVIKYMGTFLNENSIYKLDSSDIALILKKYPPKNFQDSLLLNPKNWNPSVYCPVKTCIFSWNLKSLNKKTIFNKGLYFGGISLTSIRQLENGEYIPYSDIELKKRELKEKEKEKK